MSDAVSNSFHLGLLRGNTHALAMPMYISNAPPVVFTQAYICLCISAVLETFSLALSAVHSLLVPAVVTDPEDPRFDLEKLIAKWESS